MWRLNSCYGIYLPSSSSQANQNGWRVISELPLKKYNHAFYKQTGQSQQEKTDSLFSFRICVVVRFWDCKKTKYYYYFFVFKNYKYDRLPRSCPVTVLCELLGVFICRAVLRTFVPGSISLRRTVLLCNTVLLPLCSPWRVKCIFDWVRGKVCCVHLL